jgi:cell division septation protein DedD
MFLAQLEEVDVTKAKATEEKDRKYIVQLMTEKGAPQVNNIIKGALKKEINDFINNI